MHLVGLVPGEVDPRLAVRVELEHLVRLVELNEMHGPLPGEVDLRLAVLLQAGVASLVGGKTSLDGHQSSKLTTDILNLNSLR